MWLLVAIIAQIILGSSAVFDKLLIVRRSIDPLVYAFWVGILGAVALAFVPFGLQSISGTLVFIALLSGVFFILAFYFLYRALEHREVSDVFPLVGAISPILTLLFAAIFLRSQIQGGEIFGFFFLIAGGFFVYFAEEPRFRSAIIIGALLTSIFFALSYVLAKLVFQETNFITGFFWTKMGGMLVSLGVLFSPACRRKIFYQKGSIHRGNLMPYFLNRAYAGIGSLMVSYAVFLGNPALVDATQNIRYLVVLIAARLLTYERFTGMILIKKIAAFLFISMGLFWLSAEEYVRSFPSLPADRPIHWGVTFSPKFARQLGLDWQESFSAIIDELKPQKIRLIAYWDEIESTRGEYDFSELDWQFQKIGALSPDVILALGMKVPRWPECHIPLWARDISADMREAKLRAYMENVIRRYKDNPVISVWQVENEPYLIFGNCPVREKGFLKKEIGLVKSLDPARPVLTTDGGEFGLWYRAAREGDIFGTTMYRSVYPKFIGPLVGTIEYPLSPRYFRLKEKLVRWILEDHQKSFMVSELQAEPWGPKEIQGLVYEEEMRLFNPDDFKETILYAKDAGFSEYYLWGAEWWYQLKKDHNDSRIWEEARKLLNS